MDELNLLKNKSDFSDVDQSNQTFDDDPFTIGMDSDENIVTSDIPGEEIFDKDNDDSQISSFDEGTDLDCSINDNDLQKQNDNTLSDFVVSNIPDISTITESQLGTIIENEFIRNFDLQTEELKDKFPDLNPDILKDLAFKNANLSIMETYNKINQLKEIQRQNYIAPWKEFFNKFSDVSFNDIPDEVYFGVERGLTPCESFLNYSLNQAERKIDFLSKQNENVDRATGSLSSTNIGEDSDPFLAGFNDD